MGLAPVVVEKDARAAVHLRHHHAFGAVDDKGPVVGHHRQIAHEDVLFLDIEDRTGLGFRIDLENHQLQRGPERGGIGHAPLAAFLDVVFGVVEVVLDVLQRGGVGKVGNRENRFQDLFQPRGQTLLLVGAQFDKGVIGVFLNLDQVRHIRNSPDFAKIFAHAFTSSKGNRHNNPQSALEALPPFSFSQNNSILSIT